MVVSSSHHLLSARVIVFLILMCCNLLESIMPRSPIVCNRHTMLMQGFFFLMCQRFMLLKGILKQLKKQLRRQRMLFFVKEVNLKDKIKWSATILIICIMNTRNKNPCICPL